MKKDLKKLHHWKVLAVSCIDGRFIKRVLDWVAQRNNDVFDFHTEVGLSKAIIDSRDDRKVFFEVIETSIRLHKIKEIWIFDHIDCGAYGGSVAFENLKKEKEFHKKRLIKSAEIINKKFPKLKVKKFYVEWDKIVSI